MSELIVFSLVWTDLKGYSFTYEISQLNIVVLFHKQLPISSQSHPLVESMNEMIKYTKSTQFPLNCEPNTFHEPNLIETTLILLLLVSYLCYPIKHRPLWTYYPIPTLIPRFLLSHLVQFLYLPLLPPFNLQTQNRFPWLRSMEGRILLFPSPFRMTLTVSSRLLNLVRSIHTHCHLM